MFFQVLKEGGDHDLSQYCIINRCQACREFSRQIKAKKNLQTNQSAKLDLDT